MEATNLKGKSKYSLRPNPYSSVESCCFMACWGQLRWTVWPLLLLRAIQAMALSLGCFLQSLKAQLFSFCTTTLVVTLVLSLQFKISWLLILSQALTTHLFSLPLVFPSRVLFFLPFSSCFISQVTCF